MPLFSYAMMILKDERRERERGSFACGGFAQCHAKAWFSRRQGRETNKVKRLAQQQRFPVKVMDIMYFWIAVSSVYF